MRYSGSKLDWDIEHSSGSKLDWDIEHSNGSSGFEFRAIFHSSRANEAAAGA